MNNPYAHVLKIKYIIPRFSLLRFWWTSWNSTIIFIRKPQIFSLEKSGIRGEIPVESDQFLLQYLHCGQFPPVANALNSPLGSSERPRCHGRSRSLFIFSPYLIGVWLRQSSSGLWITLLNWLPESQIWVWHRKKKLAQIHAALCLHGKDQIGLQYHSFSCLPGPLPLKVLNSPLELPTLGVASKCCLQKDEQVCSFPFLY